MKKSISTHLLIIHRHNVKVRTDTHRPPSPSSFHADPRGNEPLQELVRGAGAAATTPGGPRRRRGRAWRLQGLPTGQPRRPPQRGQGQV